MAGDIRHRGVVDMIDGQTVVVRITQDAACGGCHAKDICHAAGSREKLVEVSGTDAGNLSVGQTVTVSGSESVGMKAVWIAFGLPLLLMFVVLLTAILLGGSEKTSALIAIGVLVPYYIVVYLFRERLKRVFQFRIIG